MKTTIVCKRCHKEFEHEFDPQSRKRFCADCLKDRQRQRLQNRRKEDFKVKRPKRRARGDLDFDCFGNMENTIYF